MTGLTASVIDLAICVVRELTICGYEEHFASAGLFIWRHNIPTTWATIAFYKLSLFIDNTVEQPVDCSPAVDPSPLEEGQRQLH